MSASSSAASSSLTRPTRTGLVFFGALTAVCIFYCYRNINDFDITASNAAATGLHRSNAVHRRRRRQTNEEDVGSGQTEAADDSELLVSLLDEDTQDVTAVPLGDGETVIDDPGHDEWNWDDDSPANRNGQNIVQLLFRVSEDATRRNAYVHRGCQCNSCGTVPIRGIRYRCSNCADFDLCEACEAQGLHIKTHIFYKVRVPTTVFVSRQMQPVWYPGDPDTCMKSLPRDLITKLSKETGFERPELDAYWEQWTFMANTEWREDPDDLGLAMDRKTFNQCLVPFGGNRAPTLIHDRMFAFYDQNNDDLISFPEFLGGLAHRRKKDKLKRVFEGYDINGDGFVDRRDFLRMFRSYYVLYKQMHRDTLEGLGDQVMNSTDAHQLVTSRQPLSGAFGRDGRFPPAPDPRTGEGKTLGANGDLELTDGKGVINESGHDVGNKEDIIRDAYRNRPSDPWNPTRSSTYWRAVIDPPQTITELQHAVLDGLIRERRGEAPLTGDPSLPSALTTDGSEDDDSWDALEEQDPLRRFIQDEYWPPSFVKLEDAREIGLAAASLRSIDRRHRSAILGNAMARIRADDEVHTRWKRRHFYTDEEEGGSAPPGWDEEDDIPTLNGKAVESSKEVNTAPISPRSRSSSKVRFADDDDYDTRSNASTSSRSIAERWGGMEIAEAEKDAGKEVLYQVTQQAFNELLDPLFKKKEELVLAALKGKDSRDKYRHLFTDVHFEQWALEVDGILKKSIRSSKNQWTETEAHMRDWRVHPTIPEIELPDARQRNLDELLAASGYTVDEADPALNLTRTQVQELVQSMFDSDDSVAHDELDSSTIILQESEAYRDPTLPQFRPNTADQTLHPLSLPSLEPISPLSVPESTAGANMISTILNITNSEAVFLPHDSIPLALRLSSHPHRRRSLPDLLPFEIFGYDLNRPGAVNNFTPASSETARNAESSHRRSSRDFNPVSEDLLHRFAPLTTADDTIKRLQSLASQSVADTAEMSKLERTFFAASKLHTLDAMPKKMQKKFLKCDWMALYKLREMEMFEKEAAERGGWGRVSWEEFESMTKREEWGEGSAAGGVVKTTKNVMDYLGSWIDYCIP